MNLDTWGPITGGAESLPQSRSVDIAYPRSSDHRDFSLSPQSTAVAWIENGTIQHRIVTAFRSANWSDINLQGQFMLPSTMLKWISTANGGHHYGPTQNFTTNTSGLAAAAITGDLAIMTDLTPPQHLQPYVAQGQTALTLMGPYTPTPYKPAIWVAAVGDSFINAATNAAQGITEEGTRLYVSVSRNQGATFQPFSRYTRSSTDVFGATDPNELISFPSMAGIIRNTGIRDNNQTIYDLARALVFTVRNRLTGESKLLLRWIADLPLSSTNAPSQDFLLTNFSGSQAGFEYNIDNLNRAVVIGNDGYSLIVAYETKTIHRDNDLAHINLRFGQIVSIPGDRSRWALLDLPTPFSHLENVFPISTRNKTVGHANTAGPVTSKGTIRTHFDMQMSPDGAAIYLTWADENKIYLQKALYRRSLTVSNPSQLIWQPAKIVAQQDNHFYFLPKLAVSLWGVGLFYYDQHQVTGHTKAKLAKFTLDNDQQMTTVDLNENSDETPLCAANSGRMTALSGLVPLPTLLRDSPGPAYLSTFGNSQGNGNGCHSESYWAYVQKITSVRK